jgi:hypothetical protein
MTSNHKRANGGRLSPALIVAVIALVAALAGSAVALPGKNKVDKNDIQKAAVRTKALKDAAVTEPKLANGSVTTAKLGGAAVDSGKLADAAVDSGKIADAAVTRAKLANDAVDSAKVEAASLTGSDLANGSVGNAQIANDSVNGSKLNIGWEIVSTDSASNSNTSKQVTATCPIGKRPIGGGGAVAGLGPEIVGVTESGPNGAGTGWFATGAELQATASNWSVTAYVVCADID